MTKIPPVTLEQREIESWFCEVHGTDRWTTVYELGPSAGTGVSLFSCLIPLHMQAQALSDSTWDLDFGDGLPGFSRTYYSAQSSVTHYHRFGNSDGIEPLAIHRQFPNGKEGYAEIAEEFSLLFNLFEDRKRGVHLEALDDGEWEEVVRNPSGRIEVRTPLLRRYLAAKQMILALQISSEFWAELSEGDDPPSIPEARQTSNDHLNIQFYSDLIEPNRSFSRFYGKKLILPEAQPECRVWPFVGTKEYLDFVIGEDERGQPIEHTCNPAALSNNFGANRGEPSYLTPVFFRREVLRRYYDNPNQFHVDDGIIHRNGAWSLRVDNNHTEHVAVFLGDLGRDLPTSEQRQWRPHNIKPDGRGLSETAFRRSILGQWANPELPEHLFKTAYAQTNDAWQRSNGWVLFKELHADDAHILSSLRLLLSNTAREFDTQLLNLAKLLIDCLNEEELTANAPAPESKKNEKGIAKLERLLEQWGYSKVDRDLDLLRTIQGIRSKGAAHRKGSDYNLSAAGLDPDDFQDSFRKLLVQSITMLNDLADFVESRESRLCRDS